MFDHVRVTSVGEDDNAWEHHFINIFNDGTIRLHCTTRTRNPVYNHTFTDPDTCRKVGEALVLAAQLQPKIQKRFNDAATEMSRISQNVEDDIIDLLLAARGVLDEDACAEIIEDWHGKAKTNG